MHVNTKKIKYPYDKLTLVKNNTIQYTIILLRKLSGRSLTRITQWL